MELDSSQKNSTGHGGARPGAGRPKGSGMGEQISKKMRRKFADYVSEEQIEAIMASAVADAMDGKTEMAKFVLDQVFGKATQRQEHSGADGQPLVVALAEAIANKHATDTTTERDS